MHDPLPLGRPATGPVMAAWHGEVRRFFDRYARAFDAGDAAHVASYYSLPSLGVAPAGVAMFATRADVRRWVQDEIVARRAAGVVRATFDPPTTTIVGYEMMIADLTWQLHDSTGAVVARCPTRHHLTRRPGAWRIMTIETRTLAAG